MLQTQCVSMCVCVFFSHLYFCFSMRQFATNSHAHESRTHHLNYRTFVQWTCLSLWCSFFCYIYSESCCFAVLCIIDDHGLYFIFIYLYGGFFAFVAPTLLHFAVCCCLYTSIWVQLSYAYIFLTSLLLVSVSL